MITVIKKIIIKEKEGKRQRKKKKRLFDETRSWDLCSNNTVSPLGHEGSLAFTLLKAYF